jgi:lysophospholipase L1-like esterase
MLETEKIRKICEFYEQTDRWKDILNFRKLRASVKGVKNIFYGDSITEVWPLHEFFPEYNILNKAIRGDNVYGLSHRLEEDVLSYSPQRVFIMIGINGIDEEKMQIISCIKNLAEIMKKYGIEVFLCSILPLRYPESCERFQYQDKIVEINTELRRWAFENVAGFIDYHSLLKDETGQATTEYIKPDGIHITFEGYLRMAEVVRPYLAQ